MSISSPQSDNLAASRAGSDPPAHHREAGLVSGLIRTIRPHQWVKNLFVMSPMVFHKDVFMTTPTGIHTLNLDVTIQALLATIAFSLLAGAVYTINDLIDVEADRIHPVKRFRPIASGVVPPDLARVMAVALVVVSLSLAFWLNWKLGVVTGIYFLQNVAYSFWLKKVAFVDVSLIALGFVLRVLAGGFATGVHVSVYMIACTALLALFLGFGKRQHELSGENAAKQRTALKAYSQRALTIALAVTGFSTIVTYAAYTLDPATREFFKSDYLWLTVPFTVFGIVRFLALVGGRSGRRIRSESPTQEMLRDVPFVLNLVMWGLVVVAIVYKLQPSS